MKFLLAIGTGLAGVFSIVSPASADMGPTITVVAIGAAIWNLLLGVVTIAPRWMTGRRASAFVLYSGAVVVSWMIDMAMPIDSLRDFAVIGLLPLVASICLVVRPFVVRF